MSIFAFRKRAFLNPVATNTTSHILAHVESTYEGEYKWGSNMVIIADCRRNVELEFAIGTKRQRRLSLAKINLLRKELIVLKRNIAPVRDLVNGFIRSDSDLLDRRMPGERAFKTGQRDGAAGRGEQAFQKSDEPGFLVFALREGSRGNSSREQDRSDEDQEGSGESPLHRQKACPNPT